MRTLAFSLMLSTVVVANVARGQAGADRYPTEEGIKQPSTALATQPETPQPSLGEEAAAEAPPAEVGVDAARDAFAQPLPRKEAPAARAQASPATSSAPPTSPFSEPPRSSAQPPAASPVAPSEPAASKQIDAKQLMASLAKPPRTEALTGTPLTLAEAVGQAPSRQEQTQRVEAYWDLSVAVADYYLARREASELATLRQSVAVPSRKWDAAHLDQQNRLAAAQRTAQAAQFRLQELIGQRGTLPLPADLPCCESYDSKYDSVFAAKPSPAAEQLAQLLTLRCEELQTQANDVSEDYDWLTLVSERRSPDTDGQGLLQAHELLSLRRRAFLFTALDYNKRIAQYTELARPQRLGVERLVAMHIRPPATSLSDANLRRASTEEPVGQPPRTYARRPIDEETPAAKEPKKAVTQKSIVVDPETDCP